MPESFRDACSFGAMRKFTRMISPARFACISSRWNSNHFRPTVNRCAPSPRSTVLQAARVVELFVRVLKTDEGFVFSAERALGDRNSLFDLFRQLRSLRVIFECQRHLEHLFRDDVPRRVGHGDEIRNGDAVCLRGRAAPRFDHHEIGDIHDIGKNLVSMMMEGAGFEVIDLGINNPVENYLEALETEQPDILGMSALLTTTMPYMKVVVETLKEKGIRDDYIVMVGGAPLNEEFGLAIGADAYCRDAAVTVDLAKELIQRKHNQSAQSGA